MNFFTRLFGNPNTIIKDPLLGKLRYIESDNGTVWAGFTKGTSTMEAFDFFIDAEAKLLKEHSRNVVAYVLENFESLKAEIQHELNINHSLAGIRDFSLVVLHVPKKLDRYEVEWICRTETSDFSVLSKEMSIIEIIFHENN